VTAARRDTRAEPAINRPNAAPISANGRRIVPATSHFTPRPDANPDNHRPTERALRQQITGSGAVMSGERGWF